MFSLSYLKRCIKRRIQDPAKYRKLLTVKRMLNNFTKSSIRLGPACDSECNSIKSHKTVAAEAILKNGNLQNVKYRRY